jgi:MoxR-like ATPase
MEFKSNIQRIRDEIGKRIVGQEDVIDHVLIAIIAGGNVLLEGVPGLGKTELVKTISKVLELNSSRIQFTPDLMPSDIIGTNIINKDGDGLSFRFEKGPLFSNLVLADEINRATPKTQSAMLQAMQEKTITSGNNHFKLDEPFFVMATQNPIEMEGTYPLPEAQLDRFLFKINLLFPTESQLVEIVNKTVMRKEEIILDAVCDREMLLKMRDYAIEVPVSTEVMNYAIKLIMSTHPESELMPIELKRYVRFGSSPRAAEGIIKAGKVRALIEGRFNVSFDDINYLAKAILRHRIILTYEAMSDGITSDHVIEKIVDNLSHGK